MNAGSRYDGKPLLRLLECYVLWAIDELSAEDAANLAAMTPKLQALYGSNGQWPEIVAATVEIGPDMPKHLKAMWARNLEIAEQARTLLTPQQFAEMVVDENFAG